jgi:hypothetical protein
MLLIALIAFKAPNQHDSRPDRTLYHDLEILQAVFEAALPALSAAYRGKGVLLRERNPDRQPLLNKCIALTICR